MKTGGCIIGVRLKPGASREKIVSVDEKEVCIAVGAPPVDGKANKALIKLLAEILGIPKSRVSIRRGEASRSKLLEIEGMSKEEVFQRLRDKSL